ncbi:hypothetical protein BKA69DRAFT_296627 [Paraphysoderma sedebokerense]|nr:hypothetical protein BKA69DRAFT_296627 [Paraphysoderma sedebokerense]
MERSYRQNVSSDRYPTALRLIPETAAPSYPYEQSGNKNQPHISSSRPLSSSATSSVVYPTSVSQPQISLPSTDALLSFTSPVLGTQSNVSRVDPFLCPPSTRPDIQHPSLTSDFSLSPRPQASTQPLQLTNWSFPESQSSALNAASQIRSREAVPAKFQNTFTPYRSFLDSPSNMSSWNDYALQQGTSQPASRILYDTQMQVAPSQFSLSNMQNTNGMNRSSSLDYMGSLFNQPNAHSVAPMSTSAYKLPLPPNASPITYRRSSISQDVPVNLPVQRRSSVSVSYPSQTSSLVSSNPPHTVGQYSYQYPSPAYSPIPASRAIPSQHPPFPPPTAIPHHQPRSIDPFGSFPSYSSIVLPRPKEPESGVGPMAFELETSRKHKTYEAATGTPGAPRVCANCGTRDSPSWRRYGEGKDLLW